MSRGLSGGVGSEQESADLADFFEHSVVPMHCVGADGILLHANQAELDLLGYDRHEYVGRNVADFHVDRAAIAEILERILRGEKLVKFPAKLRAKDGSIRYVAISSSGRFRDGQFLNSRCVTIDVTAEHTRQAELETVINRTPFVLNRYSADRRYRFVSNSFAAMLNRPAEDMVGNLMVDVIGEAAYTVLEPYVERVLAGERVEFTADVPYPGLDIRRSFQMIYSPEQDERGKITGWIAAIVDITEQKRAEERIASDLQAMIRLHEVGTLCVVEGGNQQRCLRAILELAIAMTGAEKGNIQLLDPATGTLKIGAEQGFGAEFLEFFAVVDDGRSACGAAMRGGRRVIVEDVTQSDIFAGQESLRILLAENVRAVQSTPLVSSSGKIVGMISTHFGRPTIFGEREKRILDLLARQAADYLERRQIEDAEKRAQEALRQSETRWRMMAETLPNLVWTDLPDGQCDWLSSQWGKYTGIPERELLGLKWLERVIHPDDRDRTLACWQAACADKAEYDLEYRIRRDDGEYRWFKTRGVPIRDENNRIVYWFGTCTDIEDIRRAEQRERALIESNLAAIAKFEAVFNQSGIFAGIMDLDGNLREVNEFAVEACGYTRDEVLNRPFWKSPWWRGLEGVKARLRAATVQAASGIVFHDVLPYWTADGERIIDFAMHPIRDQMGEVRFLHPTGFDITERRRMEEALRESEATFRAMFSISSVGKVQADPHTGVFLRANAAMSELTGYTETELLRLGFAQITHPEDWLQDKEGIRRLVSGEAVKFDTETRYVRQDGSIVWVRATLNLISGEDGRPLRTTAVIQDINERKRAEEHAQVLMREVNHRAKNMLTLVQAIARQTAAADPKEFISRFDQRVQALAASQDVLVKSGWQRVPLESLIRAQLAHFQDLLDSRIVIQGPSLNISATAAQTIGIAVHELATNASKYGALSNGRGRVEIAWTMLGGDGVPRFRMQWSEAEGPPVAAPERVGFGSTVLQHLARMSLSADAQLNFAASGLVWEITCPASRILEGDAPDPETRLAASQLRRAGGIWRRILVVEDETLAAIDVARELAEANYEVIGPAASVRQAMRLLEQGGCDAAVLDVNLGRETSEAIAQKLANAGVPFIVTSGYAREQLPLSFADAPLLNKPLRRGLLLRELKRCLEASFSDVRSQ